MGTLAGRRGRYCKRDTLKAEDPEGLCDHTIRLFSGVLYFGVSCHSYNIVFSKMSRTEMRWSYEDKRALFCQDLCFKSGVECAKRTTHRVLQDDVPSFQDAERPTTRALLHEERSSPLPQRKQSVIVRFSIY